MTIADLGRQHQKSFGLLFQEFLRIIVFVWSLSYYFIPSILLKLVI